MADSIWIEACCGSVHDVREALAGGADRVELNSALALSGLTPSVGTMETVRELTDCPVLAMLRPREGGFVYDREEEESMLRDARALLRAGADGLVFGCLTPQRRVDEDQLRRFLDAAEGKPCVFHRAVDVCEGWERALDTLMRWGITRVLTSGQAKTAEEGAAVIRRMVVYCGADMEILPGSGIHAGNAARILAVTGCRSLHLSGSGLYADPMGDMPLDFHGGGDIPNGCLRGADRAVFAAVRQAVEGADL